MAVVATWKSMGGEGGGEGCALGPRGSGWARRGCIRALVLRKSSERVGSNKGGRGLVISYSRECGDQGLGLALIGRSPSPTKLQQGESSERPLEKQEQTSDVMQPRMRVDFHQWEEGDPKDGSRTLNATFAITECRRLPWWTSLSSISKEM
ncbi:hypothetical protein GW17_00024333 [Ensete ventricosum]|nr:hypothetical protein GW17_00024333 [Ensete ventricosum]